MKEKQLDSLFEYYKKLPEEDILPEFPLFVDSLKRIFVDLIRRIENLEEKE